MFTEDGEDEIFARQAAINSKLGISFSDLSRMRWSCPIGQDNTLIRFDKGKPKLTDRFEWLRDEVVRFGARLVIIDTAATTFGGNEIDRSQVTAFVGQVLTNLAQQIDGAVLLNAHPSRAGKATGTGDSGSTAWGASARSRWYLSRPDDGEGPGDPNARLLTRVKSNGAEVGEQIALRWEDWTLQRVGAVDPIIGNTPFGVVNRHIEVDHTFLAILAQCDAANLPVSHARQAGNYAPRVFAKRPDANGVSVKEFDASMHRLMASGRIILTNYGRASDERRRLALVPDSGGGCDIEPSDEAAGQG